MTTIHEMQELNRGAMAFAADHLKPGMNLTEVRQLCETYLLSHGADSFWYWDVGAFIFSGEDTVLSLSGRDYLPSERAIQPDDILTIDLSPQKDSIWGDYARTLILENGRVVKSPSAIQNPEWKAGMLMEEKLHAAMRRYVTPQTTFEELYVFINGLIQKEGYRNLDFLGNLGHSIVRKKSERIYIEKGNRQKLADVKAFTFEPHIALPDSRSGFKMENIYCFDGVRLTEL